MYLFWFSFSFFHFFQDTLSNIMCNLTSSFSKMCQAPRRCRQRLGCRALVFCTSWKSPVSCFAKLKKLSQYSGTLCTHGLRAGAARAHTLSNPPCAKLILKKQQMPVTSEKSVTDSESFKNPKVRRWHDARGTVCRRRCVGDTLVNGRRSECNGAPGAL